MTIDQIASEAGISNRTFFRYFASRDEVLAALPRRSLGRISELVRSRPPSESVLQAFTEAEQAVRLDPSERELVLLWGIVVDRSPVAATLALTHSAFSKADVYEQLIAERTGAGRDDPSCRRHGVGHRRGDQLCVRALGPPRGAGRTRPDDRRVPRRS